MPEDRLQLSFMKFRERNRERALFSRKDTVARICKSNFRGTKKSPF